MILSSTGCRRAASLGASCGLVIAIGGVVAGTARWLADVPPEIDGQQVFVNLELRWPEGQSPAEAMKAQVGVVTLGALSGSTVRASEQGPLFADRASLVYGRWIMPGDVRVFTGRGRRLLLFRIGEADLPAFGLPLGPSPDTADQKWSEWLPERGNAEIDKGFRYRFRIRLATEALRTEHIGPFSVAIAPDDYSHMTGTDFFAADSMFAIGDARRLFAAGLTVRRSISLACTRSISWCSTRGHARRGRSSTSRSLSRTAECRLCRWRQAENASLCSPATGNTTGSRSALSLETLKRATGWQSIPRACVMRTTRRSVPPGWLTTLPGRPLRKATRYVNALVSSHGQLVTGDATSYRQVVRIDGREIGIGLGEMPSYVMVTMDAAQGDPVFMAQLARGLDANFATGRFDHLFIEPTPPTTP